MPRGPVPASFDDLLASTTLAFVSTVGPNGGPQVNPVWFIWEHGELLLSLTPDRQKYHNIQRNPQIAVAFSAVDDPQRYLEVRGHVAAIEPDHDHRFANRLARKYTGEDFAFSRPGEKRLVLRVSVDSYTAR